MGVDYSSTLAVGIKMSGVFRIEVVTEVITKYDPDNGMPYQKQVNKDRVFLFDREVSPTPTDDCPDEWVPNVTKGWGAELNALNSGEWATPYGRGDGFRRWDYDEVVIGLSVKETGSHRHRHNHVVGVSEKLLNAQIKECKERLAKLGYTGPVEIFVVNHVSC